MIPVRPVLRAPRVIPVRPVLRAPRVRRVSRVPRVPMARTARMATPSSTARVLLVSAPVSLATSTLTPTRAPSTDPRRRSGLPEPLSSAHRAPRVILVRPALQAPTARMATPFSTARALLVSAQASPAISTSPPTRAPSTDPRQRSGLPELLSLARRGPLAPLVPRATRVLQAPTAPMATPLSTAQEHRQSAQASLATSTSPPI